MRRLIVMLLLALAACGGPASRLAERGIGGTGRPTDLVERGIGGTGIETGIVGTITGFGSVIVNGIEVADDGLTDVEIDGDRRPVGALKIGQQARVVALTVDSTLRARTIEVHHEVSGPVWRILPTGVVVVAGQRVRMTAQTQGVLPEVGNWVEVSGLRNGIGAILASRIDQRSAGDVTVSGRLVPWQGGWRIGNVEVRLPAGTEAPAQRVTATGALVDRILVARIVSSAPLIRFRPGLRRLVVQAFVQALAGRLQLGEGFEVRAGERLGLVPDQRPVVLDLATAPDGGLVATGLLSPRISGQSGGASTPPSVAPVSAVARETSPSHEAATSHGASSGAASSPAAGGTGGSGSGSGRK